MNYSILHFFYTIGVEYPSIGRFFVFISGPVSYIIIPLCVVVYLSYRAKENFMYIFSLVFLSGVLSFFVAALLKEIFRVARPALTHASIVPLSQIGGYSFPSEHASVYGALTIVLFHFDYRIGVIACILSLLVMISRLVVGVHYPLDVIVGFFVGATIAYGLVLFFKKFL